MGVVVHVEVDCGQAKVATQEQSWIFLFDYHHLFFSTKLCWCLKRLLIRFGVAFSTTAPTTAAPTPTANTVLPADSTPDSMFPTWSCSCWLRAVGCGGLWWNGRTRRISKKIHQNRAGFGLKRNEGMEEEWFDWVRRRHGVWRCVLFFKGGK